MQGRADPQREVFDVESVAGHLLPAGGMFAFLAGHRHELFPEVMFADLFNRVGDRRMPAEVIASVIVLQTLHGFSDTEAVEALVKPPRRDRQPARGLPPQVERQVGSVPGKHLAQVPLAEDQYWVGDLGPDGRTPSVRRRKSPADTAMGS